MDWKQGGETLIAIGTLLLLVVCVVLVLFVINHKRRMYGKQMLIDLYENKLTARIEKLEKINLELKKDVAMLKGVEYIDPDEELDDDDEEWDDEDKDEN